MLQPHTEAHGGFTARQPPYGGSAPRLMALTKGRLTRLPDVCRWSLLVVCAVAVHLRAAAAAPLLDGDLVAVAASFPGRWQSMRNINYAWRGPNVRMVWALPSMPAVYAARKQNLRDGNPFNETIVAGFDSHVHKYPGDFRLAMLPLYVSDYLGDTFKWLLVCDDDTVFFRTSVKQTLEQFDHTLPYFLSDSFFHQNQRPRWDVPTCLPCHSNNTMTPQLRGCPCKPEVACLKPGLPKVPVADCVRLWGGNWRWHAFGGAGWILSAGLVKQLAKKREAYETCVWEVNDYGDRSASTCLWRMGFAPTEFSTSSLGTRTTTPRLDSFGKDNIEPTPKMLLSRLHAAMQQPGSEQHQKVTGMLSWHLKERVLKKAYNNSMVAATEAVRNVIHAVEQLHTAPAPGKPPSNNPVVKPPAA